MQGGVRTLAICYLVLGLVTKNIGESGLWNRWVVNGLTCWPFFFEFVRHSVDLDLQPVAATIRRQIKPRQSLRPVGLESSAKWLLPKARVDARAAGSCEKFADSLLDYGDAGDPIARQCLTALQIGVAKSVSINMKHCWSSSPQSNLIRIPNVLILLKYRLRPSHSSIDFSNGRKFRKTSYRTTEPT